MLDHKDDNHMPNFSAWNSEELGIDPGRDEATINQGNLNIFVADGHYEN